MPSMHGEMHDDEIILCHNAMNHCRWTVEIVAKRLQRLSKSLTTLGAGGMLNEVSGYELEHGLVLTTGTFVECENDLCRCRHGITMTRS